MLAMGGFASAAHAQSYGWSQDPAQQPYRPYTAPYNNPQQQQPQQQQTYLASLQAAPALGPQSGYTQQPQQMSQQMQAPPVQSSVGYGSGPSAIGYNTFAGCNSCGYSARGYGSCGGASCGGDSCGCDSTGCCDTCCEPCGPCWGLYVGGVWLTRGDENHRTFSYDGADESYQLLDSQDSNFNDGFGPEVRLSWFNPCCCTGWEAVYWGLYPDDTYAYAYPSQVGGTLDGIFNFDQLDYNGASADNNVNGAEVHRLRRENEIHNVELNHLWQLSSGRGGSAWKFQALAGLRYFRFVDNLQFASDPTDTTFDGDLDELYYTIDAENNLYGYQVGGVAERQCSRRSRWSLTCGAKVGAFLNDSSAHSVIGGTAGTATINNGPNNGVAWDISSDKQDLSMMAELQAGLAYQIAPRWRLKAEYRVIGITGVALPTNQIYQDLRGVQDVQFLSTNGDLLLHGAFFGAEWGY